MTSEIGAVCNKYKGPRTERCGTPTSKSRFVDKIDADKLCTTTKIGLKPGKSGSVNSKTLPKPEQK